MNFLKLSLLSIALFAGSMQLQAMNVQTENDPQAQIKSLLIEYSKWGSYHKFPTLLKSYAGSTEEITDPETGNCLLQVALEGASRHDEKVFLGIRVYVSRETALKGYKSKQADYLKTVQLLLPHTDFTHANTAGKKPVDTMTHMWDTHPGIPEFKKLAFTVISSMVEALPEDQQEAMKIMALFAEPAPGKTNYTIISKQKSDELFAKWQLAKQAGLSLYDFIAIEKSLED